MIYLDQKGEKKTIHKFLFYYDQNGKAKPGKNPNMTEVHPLLVGNCSGLKNSAKNIQGDCSNIWGDCSNIIGDVSGIKGDVSGWSGDVANLTDDINCFANARHPEKSKGLKKFLSFLKKLINKD